MKRLTEIQNRIANAPLTESLFVEGLPGCGKTTAACARLACMLAAQRAGKRTLIFTPVASAGEAYRSVVSEDGRRGWVTTFNGFVQHNLNLFWPLIAAEAGFPKSAKAPLFLTIETAQVVLQSVAEPLWVSGAFNALQWTLSRFLNQTTMAMHKMAAAGILFQNYAERMRSSWSGDGAILPVFDLVQQLGESFKEICRADNMLDYALQLEIYREFLAPKESYRRWLRDQFQFFIHDNVEEDVPLAHEFGAVLRESTESGTFVCDELGGFRSFMGGDPESAKRLRSEGVTPVSLNESFVCSKNVEALAKIVNDVFYPTEDLKGEPREAYRFSLTRYYPRMIKDAARDIAALVHGQGVSRDEIVIVAPLVSDVMYTLFERELRLQNIETFAFRASRGFAAEVDSRCLLTLLALVHPDWGFPIRILDLAQMIRYFIPLIDPLRLQLFLVKAFEVDEDSGSSAFTPVRLPEIPEKYTRECSRAFLDAFDILAVWILENRDTEFPPDRTMADFFHDVLTRPGFAASGAVSDTFSLGFIRMIESLKKYRRAMEALPEGRLTWPMYMKAVAEGMVSATYHDAALVQPRDSLLISLAGGFIGLNRPFRYQFWLNAGSPSWWERIQGTLTNDAVLSRSWQVGEIWDEMKKYERNQAEMRRLVLSLLARCGERVYVYASELNESGLDQKSNLLYLFAELSARFQARITPDYLIRKKEADPEEPELWDENWFDSTLGNGS